MQEKNNMEFKEKIRVKLTEAVEVLGQTSLRGAMASTYLGVGVGGLVYAGYKMKKQSNVISKIAKKNPKDAERAADLYKLVGANRSRVRSSSRSAYNVDTMTKPNRKNLDELKKILKKHGVLTEVANVGQTSYRGNFGSNMIGQFLGGAPTNIVYGIYKLNKQHEVLQQIDKKLGSKAHDRASELFELVGTYRKRLGVDAKGKIGFSGTLKPDSKKVAELSAIIKKSGYSLKK